MPRGIRSFTVNPQTKNISEIPQDLKLSVATKVNPLVISADGKLFVLSNTRLLAADIPQPSFEVFDPNSGTSETLPPASFHSKPNYERPHRILVTGSVVIHDCILVCVEDGRMKKCSFYSYHWDSRVWKSVTITGGVWFHSFRETACVVGCRIYGFSYAAGIPLSYDFLYTGDCHGPGPHITLATPVLYQDLVKRLPFIPNEVRKLSGIIVALGKDMLCFSLTYRCSSVCSRTQFPLIEFINHYYMPSTVFCCGLTINTQCDHNPDDCCGLDSVCFVCPPFSIVVLYV